jgi:hypothetical protein
MIRQRLFVCVIGLSCLLQAGISSAQRWGRERMPQAGACFFKDINFGGDYFCLQAGQALRSMPHGMNDRISSIRVFGGADVTVFADIEMRGRSERFSGDARDLRRGGWNDLVSSIAVGRPAFRGRDRGFSEGAPAWGRERLPREGACFYRDTGFRGDYFCLPRGGSYASLPGGFNDSIRSIRVFGAGVRIFLDRDFRGRSAEVRRDTTDLRGIWRNTISSIRVD